MSINLLTVGNTPFSFYVSVGLLGQKLFLIIIRNAGGYPGRLGASFSSDF